MRELVSPVLTNWESQEEKEGEGGDRKRGGGERKLKKVKREGRRKEVRGGD